MIRDTLALVRIDTCVSLFVAMLVNAAMHVAGAAFHATASTT